MKLKQTERKRDREGEREIKSKTKRDTRRGTKRETKKDKKDTIIRRETKIDRQKVQAPKERERKKK